MRHRVKALSVIHRIQAHCLLTHCSLIRITWRLVVVRKGDIRGQCAEHDRWMNLTMSRILLLHHILISHSNVTMLGLARINIFNKIMARWTLPTEKFFPEIDLHDLELERNVTKNLAKGRCIEHRSEKTTSLCTEPDFS